MTDILPLEPGEIDALIQEIWEQLSEEEQQEFLMDMESLEQECTREIKANLIEILL